MHPAAGLDQSYDCTFKSLAIYRDKLRFQLIVGSVDSLNDHSLIDPRPMFGLSQRECFASELFRGVV